MIWFQKLTGFNEISLDQVRTNIIFDGEKLKSLVNKKGFTCGLLETPCAGSSVHPSDFLGFLAGISSGDSPLPSKVGSVYFMNTHLDYL